MKLHYKAHSSQQQQHSFPLSLCILAVTKIPTSITCVWREAQDFHFFIFAADAVASQTIVAELYCSGCVRKVIWQHFCRHLSPSSPKGPENLFLAPFFFNFPPFSVLSDFLEQKSRQTVSAGREGEPLIKLQ